MAYARKHKTNRLRGIVKNGQDTRSFSIVINNMNGCQFFPMDDELLCPSREPPHLKKDENTKSTDKESIEDNTSNEIKQDLEFKSTIDWKAVAQRLQQKMNKSDNKGNNNG